MATVQELVDDNSKDELVEIAQGYGLDTEGNKPDIAKRILIYEATGATEVPDDDVVDEVEPVDDVVEPVDEPDDDVADEPADDPDQRPTEQAGEVLVKYDGKALIYEIGGHRFGRKHPFKAMSADDADKILEGPSGHQFRVATPSQLKSFYE